MEKQRMTKEFVEGLQQATSSQTKDNPVFEARNVRGENEESLTHGIGESLIKFGEQAYPYRSKAEIY